LKNKPNIIVFFTDQQRWDTSGLHGNPLSLMENFDHYAQEGTHLFNSFTCQPVCGPARASFQTGKYATKTGVYRNHITLKKNQKTIAQYLNKHGYETAYIGKWHLGSSEPVQKNERGGYKYWLASNLLEFTSDSYDTIIYDNDNNKVKLPGYRIDAIVDAAIRYINQKRNKPFFLFISLIEPHHQNHTDDYPPPVGYREKYAGRWTPPDLQTLKGTAYQHLAGYFGMTKRIDESYGRLIDSLISLKMMDDTTLFFTSDHGNNFKTRNDEYKRSCHESSIRVPSSIVGNIFNQGGRIKNLISILDLHATILDVAGVKNYKSDGNSIIPLTMKKNSKWLDEIFIQISESQLARSLRTKKWKYCINSPSSDPWNDSKSDRYVEQFLYNLESDPYELNNLIGIREFDTITKKLREKISKFIIKHEEIMPNIKKAKVVENPGQLGLDPGSFMEGY
tara:strand:+ start:219 stop:1568 length:1350 start_codon:yes stop_codon:yes gene_type:complete